MNWLALCLNVVINWQLAGITTSVLKIRRWPSHPTVIYLIATPTLTLLNSQSQQNTADTLPLLRLLAKAQRLLQNLLRTLTTYPRLFSNAAWFIFWPLRAPATMNGFLPFL